MTPHPPQHVRRPLYRTATAGRNSPTQGQAARLPGSPGPSCISMAARKGPKRSEGHQRLRFWLDRSQQVMASCLAGRCARGEEPQCTHHGAVANISPHEPRGSHLSETGVIIWAQRLHLEQTAATVSCVESSIDGHMQPAIQAPDLQVMRVYASLAAVLWPTQDEVTRPLGASSASECSERGQGTRVPRRALRCTMNPIPHASMLCMGVSWAVIRLAA
mmetsp:Transcript_7876/g.21490  ORF Transcript_7876/g.21490 Transcript_7876/m.21490 type:complete len:218 (-) Transcript_7876:566-1219(-)